MKVVDEFNYRNAKEIIQQNNPELLKEIYEVLNNETFKLDLSEKESKKLRNTSKQIKQFFINCDWNEEVKSKAISGMK